MNITTTACAYSDQIRRFIIQEFPKSAGQLEHSDLIEILTTLVLGNARQRQGPNPNPEVQVAIREVIRKAVANNRPIPFMAPWGSVKPDGSSIDIAELMTVRNMERIHRSVTDFYRPGVKFAIRLEDVSMPYFQILDPSVEAESEVQAALRYTSDFKKLVKILDLEDVVIIRPESDLVTLDAFDGEAHKYIQTVEDALNSYRDKNPMAAEASLASVGWKGGITWEMREHYLGLYRNLYPDHNEGFHYKAMARYFASALARKGLGLRGDPPEWEGEFIDFALAQPVPGTGDLFGRRVYRRAVSSRVSGRHVAPWRAKGYLSIAENDEVSVKLRSFRQAPEDLNETVLHISSDCGERRVDVRADWICE